MRFKQAEAVALLIVGVNQAPKRVRRAVAAHPDGVWLRWPVELAFKELKQDLSLERLPSRDQHAVQTFASASLVALAVSRTISGCFRALASLVGLANHPRPTLLTRALRGTIRVLGSALRAPRQLASALLSGFVSELLVEVRALDLKRPDSFARPKPLPA